MKVHIQYKFLYIFGGEISSEVMEIGDSLGGNAHVIDGLITRNVKKESYVAAVQLNPT